MKNIKVVYVLPRKRFSNGTIEKRITNETSEVKVEEIVMEMLARIMEEDKDGHSGKIA
jgi:uncharacterized membrane-anchored protein